MDRSLMLARLALRSMLSHRVKNAIIGLIMIFGTMLVVVGTSILDSVEASMREGITASATGHIQVFSQDAEDDIAIFGQMGTMQDIGELNNFAEIERELSRLPGVTAVVPMALGNAVSFGTSELDRVLRDLREETLASGSVRQGRQEQLRRIAALMLEQNDNLALRSRDLERLEEERKIIEKVLSGEFWTRYAERPIDSLEFLETRFAPLSTEGKLLYLRYIATDPSQFADSFGRFQIVDGEEIPEGRRGLLLSKRFYETQVKCSVAREFDLIAEKVRNSQRIADSDSLLRRVARMSRGASSLVYQLDSEEITELQDELRWVVPEAQGSFEERLASFLRVSDDTIEERYAFFYERIAPKIEVYDISIEDEVVLQAFTKSGYARSVKVRVWGTFNFRGLEGSDLAGAINIMDLATFRTLYGKMTAAQIDELRTIREQAGVRDIRAEDAEEVLFGGGEELEVSDEQASDEPASSLLGLDVELGEIENEQLQTYEPGELRNGVILNAAVLLDDPGRIESTLGAISRLSEDKELSIQAVDWQRAAGVVGQFILVISLALYVAIVIIFTVALVIINNAMVMAMMERVPEIGTIRAIGAQKSTIMLLTLLETMALCTLAGGLGALAGAALVSLLGDYGLAASSDVMVFLFGGARLYPDLGASNLILGAAIILIVSLLSTIYPAIVANRVQPAVAMRAQE